MVPAPIAPNQHVPTARTRGLVAGVLIRVSAATAGHLTPVTPMDPQPGQAAIRVDPVLGQD